MEQFDTLQIQCRHIEHMHEGVYNFFFLGGGGGGESNNLIMFIRDTCLFKGVFSVQEWFYPELFPIVSSITLISFRYFGHIWLGYI